MTKVSVCLASYNGGKFIEKQLSSILSQINALDEVILVDDASKDNTLQIVKNITDSRIKIVPLKYNVGHVKAFEKAIALASNEIIFLSDQDDIWFPGKYQRILEEFNVDESTVLVVHSFASINEFGEDIAHDWLSQRAAKVSGLSFLFRELLKPSVFGSASAFKSSLREIMLPFPDYVYAHDHWLTVCASIAGNSKFIVDNLVYRRIHLYNLTPKNGLRYSKKLYVRLLFLRMIFSMFYRLTSNAYKNSKR
jgi:glycosyltransferase involved in cell wall biosynthesis